MTFPINDLKIVTWSSYDLINIYDDDVILIFENPSRRTKFLDIELKSANNTLAFDIYCKPTNSLNYLTYKSFYHSHTKICMALSLAKGIINIVIDNEEKRLSELRKYLIERNHPREIIDYTFIKCFQPKLDKNKDLEKIMFTKKFSPNHVVNLQKKLSVVLNI